MRAALFHDLVFYMFLPLLIFESALNIDGRLLLKNLGAVLALAIPILLMCGGGALAGLLVGMITALFLRRAGEDIMRGLISIIAVYCSFILAKKCLHTSGVMAALMLGLVVGRQMRVAASNADSFLPRFWALSAFVANALLFLLMGVTITLEMFEYRWLAMLIGIAGVLVARAMGVFILTPAAARLTPDDPIDRPGQAVLFWGGQRGAVTLALALSLPTELDYRWTIQSIAFGVVVFTLFVQAPTIGLLPRRVRRAT